MDDYYPFGLRYNSYARENSVPNKTKLFQGQEHIDELDLGWDSFKWRNHQPDIGRFFNVDPISEKYYYNSPYAFSENKVVAHIELEGLESVTITLARPMLLPRVMPIPLPPGEIVLPPTSTMTVPTGTKIGQPSVEATNKTCNVDWNKAPSSPDELGEGWGGTSDSSNESGGRDFRHIESKEDVRWDPGKEGEDGWKGKNHWHRHNPQRTGKKDYYLDKDGTPVPKGSDPSHIKASSLNVFQKAWEDIKEWYQKDLERRTKESNSSQADEII